MGLLHDIIDRVLFPNREQHPIPVLDGAFSANARLDGARRLGAAIDHPDDLAPGPEGSLFISSERCILRCSGPDFEQREVFATADGPVGALAAAADGRVYAGVSGHGVVAYGADGRMLHTLNEVDGTPLRCVTALALSEDGALFVTDGSRTHCPEDWLPDLMGRLPPSGRLVACDVGLKQARVLADQLAWPSGVAPAADGARLLVAEAWAHRLSSVSRSGEKTQMVIKNFAGYPARIAADALAPGWWMAFFGMRTQLVEFVLRERAFCESMMAHVPRELWIGPSLEVRFDYREPTQIGRIKKLGIRKPWAPPRSYGLVACLDAQAEPVASWHSRVDGHVHGVTSVRRVGSRVLAVAKGSSLLVELDDAEALTPSDAPPGDER